LPDSLQDQKFRGRNFGEMPFEGGHMFLFVSDRTIYVTYGSKGYGWAGSGKWKDYPVTWKEDDSEYSCVQKGEYPAIREFGEVWCKDPQVQEGLGLGTDKMRDLDREGDETGQYSAVYRLQKFQDGFIFRDSDGWTHCVAYVFFNSGEFIRESYLSKGETCDPESKS
jgi:hypothetical protein